MSDRFTSVEISSRDGLARLRRLTALAPHDPDLRLGLAAKLLELRLVEEAIEEINVVVGKDPNHLDARKLLIQALALRSSTPS